MGYVWYTCICVTEVNYNIGFIYLFVVGDCMDYGIVNDELYIVFDSPEYMLSGDEIEALDDVVIKYAPCIHTIYKSECH